MSWKENHPKDPKTLRLFLSDMFDRMKEVGYFYTSSEIEATKIFDKVWDECHEELKEYMDNLKRVSFRVRRKYFDLIVKGIKTEEIRTDKPYWFWLLGDDPPIIATFVCGKDVHRRWIERIYRDDPEKVLGRPLSEQGQQDILSDPAIIIELGDVFLTSEEKAEEK